MPQRALALLVLAFFAGIIGFGGVAASFAGLAQFLFYIFLFLLIISFLAMVARGRTSF